MRRALFLVVATAALALLSLPFEVAVAQAGPSLVLDPASGPPPDARGTLSGSGWICAGPLAVSGSGATVGGFASADGRGGLSGEFRIGGGSPGLRVTVKVTQECSGITYIPPLEQTATFTFNAPTPAPTNTRPPTRTPTPAPTSTPLPTNTPPPAPTDTPAPGVTPPTAAPTSPGAPSPSATATGETPTATPTRASQPPPGQQFLLFDGCVPSGPVSLEFVPLYLVGLQPPDPAPTGPNITVPAVQSSDGGRKLAFKSPDAEPSRLFRVTPKFSDGDCAPDPQEPAAYWTPGGSLQMKTRLSYSATLEICTMGDKSPCERPQVKGAFIHRGERPSMPGDPAAAGGTNAWDTEKQYFAEDLSKEKQRFRSSTNLSVAGSAKLQASFLPFPKDATGDPETVPGLVASWDIGCLNCEFTVDMSALAPKPKSSKSWYESTFDIVKKPFTATGGGIKYVAGKIGDLLHIGGGGSSSPKVVQAGKPQLTGAKAGDNLVGGAINPLLKPTKYYLRLLLPLESKPDENAATNSVRMTEVEKPPEFKIPNPTATPIPTESPYEVVIAGYHGILPPLNPNRPCYVATQDAWLKDMAGNYTTKKSEAFAPGAGDVHKGDLICEPDPDSSGPNIFEAILSMAEYVVDWASEAWSDIKAFAVDIALKYTPLGALCKSVAKSDTCASAFNIALDAVLLAAGVPPDIPNFHDLVDQGIDYVAAQAAAQVGIPADVVQAAVKEGGPYAGAALDYAEDKLREELQAQIKAKLGNAAKAIELGNAAAVGWVPDGIPVRPDDYLPAGLTLIVKRKAGVPGGEDGCSLNVSDTLNVPKELIQNPLPGYEWIKSLPHPLSELESYDLFADEAGGSVDKSLAVPPLKEGESFTIPLTFRPDYYHSGWSPNGLIETSQYISVWWYMHNAGALHLSVFGSCGQAKLDTPAAGYVIGGAIAQ